MRPDICQHPTRAKTSFKNPPCVWGGYICCITRAEHGVIITGEYYATRIVVGVPICQKRLRTAARTLSSVIRRSKVRDATRWPSSLKQCILVSTRLRR